MIYRALGFASASLRGAPTFAIHSPVPPTEFPKFQRTTFRPTPEHPHGRHGDLWHLAPPGQEGWAPFCGAPNDGDSFIDAGGVHPNATVCEACRDTLWRAIP